MKMSSRDVDFMLESFDFALRRRLKLAVQLEAALQADDMALIKQAAQRIVDLELPPEKCFTNPERYREFRRMAEAL